MLEQPNETVMRYRQFVDAVKNLGFNVGVDSEWITITKDKSVWDGVSAR